LAEIQDQQFRAFITVMSAEYAAHLGITFVGSISGDFAADDMVVVSDLKRGKECLATDGHTQLLYGQVMRSTVRTSNLQGKASVTLAIVAASATITNQRNFVEVESNGLPTAVQTLMLEAKNVAASGLTVETYGKFIDKVGAAEKEALKPLGSVVLIGVAVDVTDSELIAAITRAFALEYIGRGRGCLDAIQAYKRTGADQEQIIRKTYETIAKGCDASAYPAREKARELLNGIEVRQD